MAACMTGSSEECTQEGLLADKQRPLARRPAQRLPHEANPPPYEPWTPVLPAHSALAAAAMVLGLACR